MSALLRLKVLASRRLPKPAFILGGAAYQMSGATLAHLASLSSKRMSSLKVSHRAVAKRFQHQISQHASGDVIRWNDAFRVYERDSFSDDIPLAWVHKPVGGNFGDWLSPYLIQGVSGRAISHVDLASLRTRRHVLSVGSIASYANRHSLVIGSGVNSKSDRLDGRATYLMVRGHVTRDTIPLWARPSTITCCDPGFFLPELYRPTAVKGSLNKRLLVPHLNHWDDFTSASCGEGTITSANVSHPIDIQDLIDKLYAARDVVTSAMHIFVACCAYGIPCSLVKPQSSGIGVPGDGIKYMDCMSPVYDKEFQPTPVSMQRGALSTSELGTQVYDIDRNHIRKSYNHFCSLIDELQRP